MKMFTLNGKNINTPSIHQTANSRILKMTNLNVIRRTTAIKPVVTTTTIKPKEIVTVPDTEHPQMLWGEPTWLFLHTLAEKMKEEHFDTVKKGFLNIIYTICINLPCPNCAEHAKKYLDNINFKTINTKDKLKQMLCNFHNMVNSKKRTTIMSMEDCNKKYSLANTRNIIANFINSFEKGNKNRSLISDDFHRMQISKYIKEWLVENIKYFDE